MIRTVRMKLDVTHDQAAALRDTLTALNAASTHVAAVAWDLRDGHRPPGRHQLHHATYYGTRARFELAAQATVRVISRVVEAYTQQPQTPPRFRRLGAAPFDGRLLSWRHDERTASVWTTHGRIRVSFTGRPSDLKLLATHRIGQTDLIYDGGAWYLAATVHLPDPAVVEPVGFIGVDLGIVNVAVVATDRGDAVAAWSGGAVTARRKRARRLRQRLQARGTKSAKRLLKRRRRKEARYAADLNHQISKTIVSEAQRTARGIAVEDLVGIRARVRLIKKFQRDAMTGWSYHQLQGYLTYKAQAAGVPLVVVPARGTSTTCSRCGHWDKTSRRTRDDFVCKGCGWSLPADENAAVVIAQRGARGLVTAS